MGKLVGIADFKARCERLLAQMEQDGEPITVTVRGKPVAAVTRPRVPDGAFGIRSVS